MNSRDFLDGPGVGSPPCSAGDMDEGDGNPLHPCWENYLDRGAWQVPVHGVTESDMTEQSFTAQHPVILMLRLLA